MDMSPQHMLQVARLLYPANVMAVNSGSSQASAEVSKLMLTHAKYADWEVRIEHQCDREGPQPGAAG